MHAPMFALALILVLSVLTAGNASAQALYDEVQVGEEQGEIPSGTNCRTSIQGIAGNGSMIVGSCSPAGAFAWNWQVDPEVLQA